MSEETPKAAAAFRSYCVLGIGRSLAKMTEAYQEYAKSLPLLKRWSSQHHWVDRARLYDEEQSRILQETITVERAKVFTSRYALMHKRVEALDTLADRLFTLSQEDSNVWLPTDRGGMSFNGEMFRELRGMYADIASEMGERVKRTETTIKSLPKLYVDIGEDEDGSEA